MRKHLIFTLLICLIFTLTGCLGDKDNTQQNTAFKIVNIYSGLGGTAKDSLDQSIYSYTVLLESQYKNQDIKEIKITPSDKLRNKILEEALPEIKSESELIEIQGNITFDSSGMSKEDIIALEPYIKNISITLNNGTTYTLPFTTSTIFK